MLFRSVSREDFRVWLRAWPEGYEGVVRALDEDRDRLAMRLGLVSLHGARSRLAGLLLELAGRFGVRDSEGLIIDLRLTHRELAALIGATRETVSVAMLELRQAGLVRADGRRSVVLDAEGLRRIAGGG